MSVEDIYERIRFRGRPRAHPAAVVVHGDVRFTVLTPRLVRLEWSEEGVFEDRASYAFPTRYSEAPPAFATAEADGQLMIDTGALRIRYRLGSGRFTADNLAIEYELNGTRHTWYPGLPDTGNLRGTRRTLDGCVGDAPLEPGLISRDGWAVFDDSAHVVFGDDGWVAPRPDHALQDWYFFGYGHDYKAALREYRCFGGVTPLIPRFVLGAWWSRYWAYSAQDLQDLVREFEEHGVPLDVLVIDMDWHLPNAWTGYTWNRELFPDPPAFLRWVHDKGLRATLNLHPAMGVQPFEEAYPAFARAMGIDPASKQPIPFFVADKRFIKNYFELLHHPLEDQGVDFWWIDWQQGEASEIKGLDPLPWLNHLHFSDSRRRGTRPLIYSRWGGLGNHRYPIGFSGDTYVTWESLQFQPFMTATASNVLYGWWSHDIGGHMGGATPPELYARWVQYGALSPVLRLHATKDPRAERRPWAYPEPVYRAAKAAFLLRYRLIPYLYTMARINTDTGLGLCRPMYYEQPEDESAYVTRYQYYLGDQIIAAPLVFPADPATGLARLDVWLPPGTWITMDTLETVEGPRWVRVVGDLNRVPMFVREGAVLPLAPDFEEQEPPRLASGTTDALPRDRLVLRVFPGEGHFRVYQDDGTTEAYREGQYEWLPVTTRLEEDDQRWVVTIGPVEGHCEALPRACAYEVQLMGSHRPTQVQINGQPATAWSYDAAALCTTIVISPTSKETRLMVVAKGDASLVALGEAHNRKVVGADVRRLLGSDFTGDPMDVAAVAAWDGHGRGDALARLGGPLWHTLAHVTYQEAQQQLGTVIVAPPADGEPVDVALDFKLERGTEVQHAQVQHAGVTQPLIVPTPFAFDGEPRGTRWSVEAVLRWAGQEIVESYTSAPLFPSLYKWHAAAYGAGVPRPTLEQVYAALRGEETPVTLRTLAQEPRRMHNLAEPFLLRFWRIYPELMTGEGEAGAFLVVRILTAEAREAVLEVVGPPPREILVNDEPVALQEIAMDPKIPAHFRPPCQTKAFTLRAGENILIVHTVSPSDGRWFFMGRLLTPVGEPMLDVDLR